MPNKRVKCPHWRKMFHPISIFSVFWLDVKLLAAVFFLLYNYQSKSRTCISWAFLSLVYVCDFMSELFNQNKFLIKWLFLYVVIQLKGKCLPGFFYILLEWKLVHSFWIMSEKYKNGTSRKGWHRDGWQLSELQTGSFYLSAVLLRKSG